VDQTTWLPTQDSGPQMLKAQHYLTKHKSTVPVPKGLSKYVMLNPKTNSFSKHTEPCNTNSKLQFIFQTGLASFTNSVTYLRSVKSQLCSVRSARVNTCICNPHRKFFSLYYIWNIYLPLEKHVTICDWKSVSTASHQKELTKPTKTTFLLDFCHQLVFENYQQHISERGPLSIIR